MVVSTEEKELKKIKEDFTKAIKLLKTDKLSEAKKAFTKIVENNKDSSFTSIMQVQMRSNVYKEFIDFKLENKNIKLENDQDLLNEGLLMLNDGKLEKAESYFNILKDKNYSSPFFNYLLALLSIKKNDSEMAIDYLKKSVKGDASIKIHAFNESDFEILKEDENFQSIIE